jgi:4-oxalomesaconate hydratase
MLIFSAHAADFVWRAGGAIALYASRGYRVRILCLSFGERGESQGAWKEPGMTVARVKEIRRAESQHAADLLGAEVRFFDAGDYPLRPTDTLIEALVQEYRTWTARRARAAGRRLARLIERSSFHTHRVD